MTSIYQEQAAEQKLRDECGIPEDWDSKMWESNVRFVGDTGPVARQIAEEFGVEDWTLVSRTLIRCTQPLLIPEGCRMFSFTPPLGHEDEDFCYLVSATKRDLEMGTNKYLSRLDEDQLYYAQDTVKDLLKQKKEESSRTVWRVCNDFMCLGNFREEDYIKAVEFMAEQARKRHDEEPKDSLCARSLEIEIKAEKVPESEYESFFE